MTEERKNGTISTQHEYLQQSLFWLETIWKVLGELNNHVTKTLIKPLRD